MKNKKTSKYPSVTLNHNPLLKASLSLLLLLQAAAQEPTPDTQSPTTDPSSSQPSNPDAPAAPLGSVGVNGGDGTIPPGGTVPGDILNFQADLFTGRFTYRIPIAVAPARQGAEPSIALTYNSSAGNGWCGVGWGLDVGFIVRDTRKGVPIKWAPWPH